MVKLGHLLRLLGQVFREVDLVLPISPVNGQRACAQRVGPGTAIPRVADTRRRIIGQVDEQLAGRTVNQRSVQPQICFPGNLLLEKSAQKDLSLLRRLRTGQLPFRLFRKSRLYPLELRFQGLHMYLIGLVPQSVIHYLRKSRYKQCQQQPAKNRDLPPEFHSSSNL